MTISPLVSIFSNHTFSLKDTGVAPSKQISLKEWLGKKQLQYLMPHKQKYKSNILKGLSSTIVLES